MTYERFLPLRCNCGSNNLFHYHFVGWIKVKCEDCDETGPVAKTENDATRLWNRRILFPSEKK